MTAVGEFSTGWGHDYERGWADRTMDDLVGVAKGGHLFVPLFRPFDYIDAPNELVTILKAESNRMGVDAPRGTQATFHRNTDFDEVFFQWAGTTTYETEMGTMTADTADLLFMPSGLAHRATGSADSLRMSLRVRDPLTLNYTEENHIGHTAYHVKWQGGPDWPVPPGEPPRGRVLESLHTWDDEPGDETLMQREYDRYVGAMTQGRPMKKVRIFDTFTDITGRKGPGPTIVENDHFRLECFNSTGTQFGFHRGNRADEAQFQYVGPADNHSEYGLDTMQSGDLAIVRRGVSHRVTGSLTYRRITFYSKERWTVCVDAAHPPKRTTFDAWDEVIERAPWRDDPVFLTAAK